MRDNDAGAFAAAASDAMGVLLGELSDWVVPASALAVSDQPFHLE
jgi:hypothetical protein